MNRFKNLGILLCCFVLTINCDEKPLYLKSKLNTFELENFKYQIDIDQSIKLSKLIAADGSEEKLNIIPIRSSNGQKYECQLGDPLNSLILQESKLFDLDDSSEEDDAYSARIEDSQKNPQYNFTLINEKIKNYMEDLKKSDVCVYKNLGWWTYEFCFGKYATQYHLLANGTIMGEKISLGNFTHDFNWLKANQTKSFPISSGILYHEQFYESGSICELTNKPRRAMVKIFCDETSSNYIDLISEIETCVYEIYINTKSVCSVPNFSKKPNNFDIKCSPVVESNVYEKYLKTKQHLKELKEQQKKLKEEELEKKKEEEKKLKQEDIVAEIAEGENAVSDLAKSAEKFKKIVNNLASGDQKLKTEGEISDVKDLLKDTANQILKTDELIENIAKKVNRIVDDLDESEEFENDQLDDAESSMDKHKVTPASNEPENSIKDLEKVIQQKLGEKLKKNKIQVKIIKLDSDQGDLLADSADLNSILSTFLESNKHREKIKSFKLNYNRFYTEDSIDDFVNQELEMDQSKPVKATFQIFNEDEHETDTDDNNENKMIIY